MRFTNFFTPRRQRLALGALLAGAVGVTLAASPAEARWYKGEVEGLIADRSGACPNVSFKVLGTPVKVDGQTRFKRGACQELADGKMVEVKVPLQPKDGAYTAYKVKFKY